MTGTRLQIAAMLMAGAGLFVTSSGDAQARYRCRQGWRQGNAGYTYANNGYSYTNNGAYTNGAVYNTPASTAPIANGAAIQPANPQPVMAQPNGTYSTAKPVYADPALPGQPIREVTPVPTNPGPAPVNTLPNQPINNRPFNAPNNNPSPDADNSARNLTTSGIPGTSPAKAPQPAAAAAPIEE